MQRIALEQFKKYSVENLFVHGIGHRLGLDVHDCPRVAGQPLRPGDVITIEPGIYDSQRGIGIRIEDDYLVTENGLCKLS